jgi:hypothetical protein
MIQMKIMIKFQLIDQNIYKKIMTSKFDAYKERERGAVGFIELQNVITIVIVHLFGVF